MKTANSEWNQILHKYLTTTVTDGDYYPMASLSKVGKTETFCTKFMASEKLLHAAVTVTTSQPHLRLNLQ
jgi:hypothetical protein